VHHAVGHDVLGARQVDEKVRRKTRKLLSYPDGTLEVKI
jgi:hypothetical protein